MSELPKPSSSISRRKFGKVTATAASAAFGFQFIPSAAWGNLTKPTLVAIGAGGRGMLIHEVVLRLALTL